MSGKNKIQETLVSMGFKENYITRAFKVYEKNYGHSYNIEVITEIIVRLQNKDKTKQAKNAGNNKDKSPSKQSSSQKSSKSKDNSNKIPKQSPSKPQPKPHQNKSKPPKPQPKPQSKDNHNNKNMNKNSRNNQQININANSNKPKPKQNQDIAPKAYSNNNNNNNYSHNQQHNMPHMGGMNRAHSGGKKRKPNKPPPNNPSQSHQHQHQQQRQQMNHQQMNQQNQNNGNMGHIKSQSQSYRNNNNNNNKQNRPSPSAPPRFKKNDIVIYKGIEAEINRIRQDGMIELTYPINKYIMQRQSTTVTQREIQKKQGQKSMGYNNMSTQRQGQTYNANNIGSHNNQSHHQYSPSHNSPSHNSHKSHNQSPQLKQPHHSHGTHSTHNNNPSPQLKQSKPINDSVMSTNANDAIVKVNDDNNSNIPTFTSHMNSEEANRLKIHDKIDHRDQVGRFVYATVSEKQGTNLKIHYDGWSRKWDTWSDFGLEIHRFAHPGSISKRQSHRFRQLKKGDYVDINPTQRHPGWKCGEIRRLDQKSGQVQVVYESADKNYLYWAHLDNVNEIAAFTTKSGTNQQTQIDIMNQKVPNNNNNQQQNNQQNNQMGQQQQQNNNQMSGQQQMDQMNAANKMNEMDEMEAFKRIRAKRFPRYPNEKIDNPYGIGDWLEVQDTQTHQWITATVIDKENNWIVVHFDGWPSKYDQKIHASKHKKRLRDLGSGLQETQEEKDIKQEMTNFLKEVQELSWKLAEVDADGNCLYRCFAINIYNDTTKHMQVRAECCTYMRDNKQFFQNFIPDFELRMGEKEQEYEWGDHVDITALSELYNVRVRVFEYDKSQSKLYMSFDQGEHEETVNLPLILLARHRKKHYNIITDPQAIHKRPLNTAKARAKVENISLKELRLREDKRECQEEKDNENKDDEKDIGDDNGNNDMDMDNNNIGVGSMVGSPIISGGSLSGSLGMSGLGSLRNVNSFGGSMRNVNHLGGTGHLGGFNVRIVLEQHEFTGVLEMWNLSEPLGSSELKNIFGPIVSKIYKKIEFQITNNYKEIGLSKDFLNRFWKQQFEQQPQASNNCKRWINALKEKIPNHQFTSNACINTFNQTIVNPIMENLHHIIQSSRKRQSTIDVNRNQHQSMDIDQ